MIKRWAMFKRRIQVISGSTFMVSLPKEWVRLHNLKGHDEVVMEILPDLSLKISPVESRRSYERFFTYQLSGNKRYDIIQLVSAYLVGYDEIRVDCSKCSPEYAKSLISELISKTLGLEVLETSQYQYVIKNVAGELSIGVNEIILRVFRILRLMLQDLADIFEKNSNLQLLGELSERDSLVDKLTLYGLRVFNKIFMGEILPKDLGFKSFAEVNIYYNILKNLERAVDHVSYLAKDTQETSDRIEEDIRSLVVEYARSLGDFSSKIMDVISKSETSELEEAILVHYENLKALSEKLHKYLLAKPNYFFIYDHLHRIRGYLLDILELVSDMRYISLRLKSFSS
ncbi:AbrB/MazE/SpoVT family DNA-binding domain-containing protein [Thermogladius sp. 4427co]|uniref:AbrB/MazE/SpoVT family DNA-binding domain-containing protein n=1 Tax=Thermogladius sp. 4427co TaxID=3450718 RepID=UPI003F78D99A